MAAYGAQLKEGRTPAQAQAYLTALFTTSSARTARRVTRCRRSLAGRGDALIDYEDEAIATRRRAPRSNTLIPQDTILIQNPVAVVGSGASSALQPRASSTTCSPRRPGDLGPPRATDR